jgi:hypothetical protein
MFRELADISQGKHALSDALSELPGVPEITCSYASELKICEYWAKRSVKC